MSLEDIKSIKEAEKNAAALRSNALIEAKRIISEAERNGEIYANQAKADAEEKVRILLQEADTVGQERILVKRAACTKVCEALESHANSRLDQAASIIVERIVNA